MSQLVTCTQCRQELRIPSELAGKKVKCPACAFTFVAAPPLPSEVLSHDDRVGREEEPVTVQPRSRRQRRRNDEDSAYDDSLSPHRGSLILVLGIMSILASFVGCAPVGLALGLMAWIMGGNDLQAMAIGTMDRSGESETGSGRTCGIIGTVLNGIGFFCIGVYILFFAAVGVR